MATRVAPKLFFKFCFKIAKNMKISGVRDTVDTALAVTETPLLGISWVSDTTDVATKNALIVRRV
jgi:hypothetical protein